ncbi:MAG TPA: TIGR01459 family HAD-type hydrolase [Alphaproteobacteria bacterium]|nr:TIGR01459 family HAD-type hydrolase [Alphaproteobacteria bacterium]
MPPESQPGREIKILTGIGSFLGPYEGLILDLWGVIHDGRDPYPGVTDTLARVMGSGRKVVMLSNAPRRSSAVIEGMTVIGIGRGLYHDVLSSGELAWRALKRRDAPWAKALGRRCLHVGPARDEGLFDGLDVDLIAAPEEGAFILNTGPWEDEETVADYEVLLADAAACRMPMICANPDIEVIRGGKRIICAGALARRYTEMGGDVRYFGKPDPDAYRACLDRMGAAEPARVLAVGDSLSTDILGAQRAGLDAVLVTSGIHAEELGLDPGEPPDPARLAAACARAGAFPLAAVPAFVW